MIFMPLAEFFVFGAIVLGAIVIPLALVDKRGLEYVHGHAIFSINDTNLHGHEVKKLDRLKVEFLAHDTALFSTKDFSVHGNISIHPNHHHENGHRLISGDLSFQIPGLDKMAQGRFVHINQTAADEKTKDDFDKVYAKMHEMQLKNVPQDEMVARIKEGVQRAA